MLPADAPALAELFQASIAGLCEDDYDEDQLEAWRATVADEGAFGRRLQAGLTLVATRAGAPVGFIALKGSDCVDMLYVHPDAARQGIATVLLEAVEKLAGARGAAKLTADASDTARAFFEARGFAPQYRQTVTLGGEWLGNTRMEKALGGGAARS